MRVRQLASGLTTAVRRLARPKLAASASPNPYGIRETLANRYIHGEGIEVGALNHPLRLPPRARVKFVDRLDIDGLRREFPELNGQPLVDVDIVDDGETLRTVPEQSQDFVVANHFLEHSQNPIGTVRRFLEVLKPRGILYLAVPEKHGTFDRNRPVTALDHLHRDDREGPAWSYRDHIEEYATLVDRLEGPARDERVRSLIAQDYRIHFHVWTHAAFGELLDDLRRRGFGFRLKEYVFNPHLSESIGVLRRV
jgi:hypothetical protein